MGRDWGTGRVALVAPVRLSLAAPDTALLTDGRGDVIRRNRHLRALRLGRDQPFLSEVRRLGVGVAFVKAARSASERASTPGSRRARYDVQLRHRRTSR